MAEKTIAKRIEITLENLLFSSRWLLAPFYFGLAISLIILLIKFVAELAHLAGNHPRRLRRFKRAACALRSDRRRNPRAWQWNRCCNRRLT